MSTIRSSTPSDWPAIWAILEPVFRAGETYAYSPDISEAEAHNAWVEMPQVTYVAEDEAGTMLGTYFLRPNQPGLGSHVCNCGYVVASAAQRKGVATLMGQHSQQEAQRFGFRAIQYNFVISTNTVAVRLWQKLGMEIVGTLPGAFKHPKLGYVDVFVMYKSFVS
ncbi:MAG: GNAT family N-acetyltransferase [Cyanobacteria bacterium P01_F01_bin.150]